MTLGPTPGPQGLASGLLQLPDLGPGWTAHPGAHAMAAAEYRQGPCGSSLWAHNTGGYQASYINGAATEQSHGALVNFVLEAPSASVASQQQALVASPAFLPCLERTAAQEAASEFPVGSGETVGQVTANPFTLNLPASTQSSVLSTCYVLTIPVLLKGKVVQTITDDSVTMFAGVYEATLDVSWSSLAPLTQQIVQLQAAALAIHLAALPPSGTH